MVRNLFCGLVLLVGLNCTCFSENGVSEERPAAYQIAVYYWPSWHANPLYDAKMGRGWTEWELLKQAKPRFAGHEQPRIPLWGYRDESDPKEMARSIDAMADHSVTTILFDWYRFDDGGALNGALDNGFLRAPNRQRLKFALMWANEDFADIYPIKSASPAVWRRGTVSRQTFDHMVDEAISRYFVQPNYWKIDGKPYFSIYVVGALITGLGGLKQTRDALEHFRAKAKEAGFPGVHVNIIGFALPGEAKQAKDRPNLDASQKTEPDTFTFLGADSVTCYTWAHATPPSKPTESYDRWAARSVSLWSRWQKSMSRPFFPNVSLGWDGSPRNYPSGIVVDNSPALVRKYLEKAKRYLDLQPADRRILTLNSWNEWTEQGTLEPDTKWGLGYLEAVQQVFGTSNITTSHEKKVASNRDAARNVHALPAGEDHAGVP